MSRPLRICFVCYRGNMQSGGQGIYLWFLARELARLGHSVDALVGPPYPDAMPFARDVTQLPNERFWGKWFFRDWQNLLPKPNPLRVFEPLNFWEFGASAIGFLPEPFAFSVRAFRELGARLRAGPPLRPRARRAVPRLRVARRPRARPARRDDGSPSAQHRPPHVLQARPELSRGARHLGVLSGRDAGLRRAAPRPRVHEQPRERATDRGRLPRAPGEARDDRERHRHGAVLARANAPRAARELLCVARASDPNKGVRVLLEALLQLPGDVRVTLVDDAKSEALAWAKQLGVLDRLCVTGRLDTPQLVQLYRRATLVVVPSRYEGFGLPAAEAMACGTPVVATRAGALPEVIATGGGGVLAPVDDAPALAKEIAALLAAPALRSDLAARGRAGVVAAYSWPSIAARTLAEYRSVLSETRRS